MVKLDSVSEQFNFTKPRESSLYGGGCDLCSSVTRTNCVSTYKLVPHMVCCCWSLAGNERMVLTEFYDAEQVYAALVGKSTARTKLKAKGPRVGQHPRMPCSLQKKAADTDPPTTARMWTQVPETWQANILPRE